MAVVVEINSRLIESTIGLRDALSAKAEAWKDIIKTGRTHMQDATPLTLGQEFSGYAAMLTDNIERVRTALEDVCALPLGGTAVGTGVNTHASFAGGRRPPHCGPDRPALCPRRPTGSRPKAVTTRWSSSRAPSKPWPTP